MSDKPTTIVEALVQDTWWTVISCKRNERVLYFDGHKKEWAVFSRPQGSQGNVDHYRGTSEADAVAALMGEQP